MGNISEDSVYKRFELYMKKLYNLSSNAAVCKEAAIDRSFYNRVIRDDFHGGIPDPKNVTALCKAIVLKESLKKPVTAQDVLDGLLKAGLLPEGSMLEPEKQEAIEDQKAKFDETTSMVFQKMQEKLDEENAPSGLPSLDEFRKHAEDKSSMDFGWWK